MRELRNEMEMEQMRRLLRPMRIAQVAREAGLSPPTVFSFLAGKNARYEPSLETIAKLRNFLVGLGALKDE